MLSTTHQSPLKMKANVAATDTYCTAVATAEPPAELVSFQRSYASVPPTQNVNSAARSLTPARQFSGNSAICAVNAANAVITATSVTF